MKLNEIKMAQNEYTFMINVARGKLNLAAEQESTEKMLEHVSESLSTLKELISSLKADVVISKAQASSQNEAHQLPQKITQDSLKTWVKSLANLFTNAQIEVEPYNKTEFRLSQLETLFDSVSKMEQRLVAQLALEKAAGK